jgi:hypothetical protein
MSDRDSDGMDDDDEAGLDLGMVRDYLGYAVRAVRLHWFLMASIFVCVVAAAYGALLSLPKSYHVETKLLAQKDAMPGHGTYWSDPLKGSSDVVMSHDHLASLVKQMELTTWWQEHLSPAQRFKTLVMGYLGRKPTEDEQVRILIDILSTKMNVFPGDNTVTITLDWPSGEMAARIVDTAEQNFLEKRHILEISTIAESISILEEHATRVRKEIEDMAPSEHPDPAKPQTERAAENGATPPHPATVAGGASRAPRRRPEFDAELVRQKAMIETKQRAVTDLEDFRQRRVLELQANLSEQRSKYTDQHPIIVGIEQNIATFSKESPQVASLRAEVKTLQETYDHMSREAEGPEAGGAPRAAAPTGATETPLLIAPREERNPTMEAQISYAVANFSKIRSEIDAAKVDLDFAQAAFRHRYSVIQPAEPPRGPSKPKIPLMMGAAVGAALLLGLLAAVAAELRSGRFVNRWQVERLLKLPVLAEVLLPGGTQPPPH